MQNTNIPLPRPALAASNEEAVSRPRHVKPQAAMPAVAGSHIRRKGFLQRLLAFLQRLFFPAPALAPMKARAQAEAAQPPHSPPPLAFKGGTAYTLATPMGAYAGKPAQQRLRKLAEQQFHQMDVSQTTMN